MEFLEFSKFSEFSEFSEFPPEIQDYINLFIPTSPSRAAFLIRKIARKKLSHKGLYCSLCGEPHLKTGETCTEFSNKLWMKKTSIYWLRFIAGGNKYAVSQNWDEGHEFTCWVGNITYLAKIEMEQTFTKAILDYLRDITLPGLKVTKIWETDSRYPEFSDIFQDFERR